MTAECKTAAVADVCQLSRWGAASGALSKAQETPPRTEEGWRSGESPEVHSPQRRPLWVVQVTHRQGPAWHFHASGLLPCSPFIFLPSHAHQSRPMATHTTDST